MSSEPTQSITNTNAPTLLPNNDPSSVYYIHPSDYSPQSLVSTKFNGTGFGNWKKCMLMAFSTRNKLDFLKGTLPRPPETDSKHAAWDRCNDNIMSWIVFNLDPKIAEGVMSYNTAAEIWKDLEEKFAFTSHTKIFNLEKKLGEIEQGEYTVLEFYTKYKVLWDELETLDLVPMCVCNNCTCNLTGRLFKQQQNRKLIRFMMKLRDVFQGIRSNVLMMKDLPPITEAYRLFAQEEDHKESTQTSTDTKETLAFAANHQKTYTPNLKQIAYTRNSQNPTQNDSNPNQSKKRDRSTYFCTHCKIPGHSLERCFKVHGYPPGFRGFKDKRVAATVHSSMPNDSQSDASVNSVHGNDGSAAPNITVSQYNYLLEMIHKQGNQSGAMTGSSTSKDPESTHQANLAGALLERATNSSW